MIISIYDYDMMGVSSTKNFQKIFKTNVFHSKRTQNQNQVILYGNFSHKNATKWVFNWLRKARDMSQMYLSIRNKNQEAIPV